MIRKILGSILSITCLVFIAMPVFSEKVEYLRGYTPGPTPDPIPVIHIDSSGIENAIAHTWRLYEEPGWLTGDWNNFSGDTCRARNSSSCEGSCKKGHGTCQPVIFYGHMTGCACM